MHTLQKPRQGFGVGLGERGQGIKGREQHVGLGLVKVNDEDWHHLLGIQGTPEVPVDENELLPVPAGQQDVGVTDLPKQPS